MSCAKMVRTELCACTNNSVLTRLDRANAREQLFLQKYGVVFQKFV